MQTLGAYLRRGRERSGLSMEAVSAGSRIVPRLVEALEADRQDLLPAPVYVRGFIRAYCEQIGADTEEALRLYDEQAAPPPAAHRAAVCSRRRRSRSCVAGDVSPRSRPWAWRWAPPGSFSSAAASRTPSRAAVHGAVASLRTRPAPPSALPHPPVFSSAPAPVAPLTSATAPPAAPVSSAPKPRGPRACDARDRHDVDPRPARRRPRDRGDAPAGLRARVAQLRCASTSLSATRAASSSSSTAARCRRWARPARW